MYLVTMKGCNQFVGPTKETKLSVGHILGLAHSFLMNVTPSSIRQQKPVSARLPTLFILHSMPLILLSKTLLCLYTCLFRYLYVCKKIFLIILKDKNSKNSKFI